MLKPEAEKAMQYCSRKECCRKEIFDKVLSWGCTPAEADELVDFLAEQKFIDERRYTEAFVKDRMRFNKWGRMKISYMLHSKNIDNSIITSVLSEIDDTEYKNMLTEEIQKKIKNMPVKNEYETKGKIFRFASGRGFESEIINDVIFKLLRL